MSGRSAGAMAGRRAAAVLAATAGLLAAGGGTALAATVTKDGDTITFTADPAEANALTITEVGSDLRFDESVLSVTQGAGCNAGSGPDATCPFVPGDRVVVDLGDEHDSVTAAGVTLPTAIDGGTGRDSITGGSGDDTLAGGGADDVLDGGPGTDVLGGGSGFDLVTYRDRLASEPITASLDGQANDGAAGEDDLIAADVEDLTDGAGDDTLTGDAGYNVLTGTDGEDTLDPAAGEDVVHAFADDDTIAVRDGFADLVRCGDGIDTVTADTIDRVAADCENVTTTDVGVAREDRPPTVAFAGPSENVFLPTASASTVTALATDDRGVAEVRLIDDGRVVETDDSAPYTFRYRPRADDVGRNTLVLVAVDTAGQTASAVRPLRVARFAPRALNVNVTPTRDRWEPFRYRTSGRLGLPATVPRSLGCGSGRVAIQIKRGRKTISTRRVRLSATCRFSSSVTFHNRRRVGDGRLRFIVRFLGNSVLIPRKADTLSARTR